MFTIKQPSTTIFGKHSVRDYELPEDSLVITSNGANSRGWIDYTKLNNAYIFDNVETNPSIKTVEKIIGEFKLKTFSHVVGIGGGSSLDVAKFVAFKLKKRKIMIPTTFGSGSEVTRISVLKVNGKKQSFHDDGILADIAIVDPYFINNTPLQIIKNSVIDACAQCTEAYDSKNSNIYTKFLCEKAFDILEDGILNNKVEKFPLGSLMSGLGFGNSSTTFGHALSYVYSNEGYSHGHALAFTTCVAHKFNKSKFYYRFKKIVEKLKFTPIKITASLNDASELILEDRKHLDNNPCLTSKKDIENLLEQINLAQI